VHPGSERDRLVAERTGLEAELVGAREPLARLDAVIAGADWAAGKLAALEAAHDRAVGEAMAAGLGDPPPSNELVHARAEADLTKRRAETAQRARPAHEVAVQRPEAAIQHVNAQIGDIDAAREVDELADEYEQFTADVQALLHRWAGIEGRRRRIIIGHAPAAMGRLSRLDQTIAIPGPQGAIQTAYECVRDLFSAIESRARNDSRPGPITAPPIGVR
jgi:hypothetical protein